MEEWTWEYVRGFLKQQTLAKLDRLGWVTPAHPEDWECGPYSLDNKAGNSSFTRTPLNDKGVSRVTIIHFTLEDNGKGVIRNHTFYYRPKTE